MEKSSNELKDFFERNPKAYEMAEQTYERLSDIDDMLKKVPEDRPAPIPAPPGSPPLRGLGAQARQRGILLEMKEKIEKDYETDLKKNYPELDDVKAQKIVEDSKEYVTNKRLEKENQTKADKLKSEFSQSKRDIERGDVSKRIMDSLRSSRVGKGVEQDLSKNKPEKDKSLEHEKD
jgi:hypothetical protein